MKFIHYKRVFLGGERIAIRRHSCCCTHGTCGKYKRTTGWAFIFFSHMFILSLDMSDACDAPF